MKKSIIEEIFHGERGHYETIKESDEYWGLMDRAEEINKKLEGSFNEEQKELFNKLEIILTKLNNESILTHFTEGFKLGLALGIECMEEE